MKLGLLRYQRYKVRLYLLITSSRLRYCYSLRSIEKNTNNIVCVDPDMDNSKFKKSRYGLCLFMKQTKEPLCITTVKNIHEYQKSWANTICSFKKCCYCGNLTIYCYTKNSVISYIYEIIKQKNEEAFSWNEKWTKYRRQVNPSPLQCFCSHRQV